MTEPCFFPTYNRENITLKRIHERLLHTSIVRCCTHFVRLLKLSTAQSEPTVFENYVHDLYVDDQVVELSLWDTAGA
jgi:GTPase SAR1 family protein